MTRNDFLKRLQNVASDRLPAAPDRLIQACARASQVSPLTRTSTITALALLSVVAADPVAAQCSSALDSTFNSAAGMVFGYGRPLVGLIAFVAFLGMITSPILPYQNVVAGGVLVIIIVGLVGIMIITAFTQQSFDAMGAPDACVTVFGSIAFIGKAKTDDLRS